jgi:hypothetical protein
MVWLMILGTAVVTFRLRFSFLGTVKPHADRAEHQERCGSCRRRCSRRSCAAGADPE